MRQFLVIGLGRFGIEVARALANLNYQVLAIDISESRVREIAAYSTRALQCDATDIIALKSSGARNFDVAVVAIGDLKASSQVTILLKEIGLKHIVAKAQNELHGKILYKLGADRVVFTERDMGVRLAHNLVAANILDYIEITPDYGIMEVMPTTDMHNKTLQEANLRNRYGVNVLAIKDGEKVNITPHAEDIIREGNALVVIGSNEDLKRIQIH